MKYLSKIALLLLVAATMFQSCKKDDNQIVFEGGTAPTLSANRAANSTIPMAFVNRDNEAITFMWTNPKYSFTTGVSSQDVAYTIEIDTAGANFTSANRRQLSVSKDLSRVITQGELNDILLNNMLLTPLKAYTLEVRVISNLVNNTSIPQLISNSMRFTITPFAIPPKVDPPTSGELYLVGNASPGGWSNPVPVPSQKFTQVSPTLYELTVNIIGGGSLLFLPVNGSWSDKYGFDGPNNANNVNTDNLRRGGGDMLAPAVSGSYKITVDFQRGRFTFTKL
ncbi:MAG: SusE domain-containing protein [Chitinophagaceae bacterium]